MTIDERISSELRRHAPDVDEHAAWQRFQSAAPVRHRVWTRRLMPVSVVAFGVVLIGLALVRIFPWNPGPVAAFESPFRGAWVTTDADGSNPTMAVQVSGEGVLEIVALDDLAPVCSGAPSTMTGTGRLDSDTVLVIPVPVLTCDDGSEPQALSGLPLEEQLLNLTFTYDEGADTLADNLGSVWAREGVEPPSPDPTIPDTMWPQSSLEEVEEAQRLADAGDADYTWQVDPKIGEGNNPNATVAHRYIREVLGWENFLFNPFVGWDQPYSNLVYIQCAPREANPLYPDDELAGRCAPTINELRYETVTLDLAQPGQQGPTGIWVVSDSTTGNPFFQVAPPTAEAEALVEDFLQARIEGEGAEEYLEVPENEVPLLYETTSGAPYERFQFERVGGPLWPFGEMEFKVRLFAGETVVEQRFSTPDDGGLGLEYRTSDGVAPGTENGQPIVVPDDIFHDGQVILYAPHPWRHTFMNDHGLIRDQGSTLDEIQLVRNPLPVGTGCEAGAAQPDAEALAESIRSDSDLETTPPVAVSLGGLEAISMEVVAAPGASVCEDWPAPLTLTTTADGSMDLAPGNRMRLFLLDLPEGLSARTLAIAVTAPEERFETVMEEATSILDSLELNAG